MSISADDELPTKHPIESALAGYLDGQLSGDELAELERHLDECADCRALLAETTTVLAEGTTPPGSVVGKSAPAGTPTLVAHRSRRRWYVAGLALAASIAAILLARPASDRIRDGEKQNVMRRPGGEVGEDLPTLAVYRPSSGANVSRAELRFAWSPLAAERFHFVLASDDGTPVFEGNTGDTTLVLPDSVRLEVGKVYFWHVDAVAGGLTASTRLQRFTISSVP